MTSGEGKPWQLVPSMLRHYLRIDNPGHRRALTKLLVADHGYGDEALGRRTPPIPLDERRCRLCGQGVETPAHVWLECSDQSLVAMRRSFVAQLLRVYTEAELEKLTLLGADATGQLVYITRHRPTVSVVAQYAYEVQEYLLGTRL